MEDVCFMFHTELGAMRALEIMFGDKVDGHHVVYSELHKAWGITGLN